MSKATPPVCDNGRDGSIKCIFGCDDPAGLFYLPLGCSCFDDREQYLCAQHWYNCSDIDGIYIVVYWGA